MNSSDVFQTAKSSIRSSFSIASWWQFVQPSVQKSFLLIIENLEILGIPFRDSFRGGCSLKVALRKLQGVTCDSSKQSVLFGSRLTEEEYQTALEPSKFSLGLQEWDKPGEADIYACKQLCDQIDLLEKLGLFQIPSQGPNKGISSFVSESGEWKFDA